MTMVSGHVGFAFLLKAIKLGRATIVARLVYKTFNADYELSFSGSVCGSLFILIELKLITELNVHFFTLPEQKIFPC